LTHLDRGWAEIAESPLNGFWMQKEGAGQGRQAGWPPLPQDAGMAPLFDPHRTDVRRQRAAKPSAAISSGRLMLMRSLAIFHLEYAVLR